MRLSLPRLRLPARTRFGRSPPLSTDAALPRRAVGSGKRRPWRTCSSACRGRTGNQRINSQSTPLHIPASPLGGRTDFSPIVAVRLAPESGQRPPLSVLCLRTKPPQRSLGRGRSGAPPRVLGRPDQRGSALAGEVRAVSRRILGIRSNRLAKCLAWTAKPRALRDPRGVRGHRSGRLNVAPNACDTAPNIRRRSSG